MRMLVLFSTLGVALACRWRVLDLRRLLLLGFLVGAIVLFEFSLLFFFEIRLGD